MKICHSILKLNKRIKRIKLKDFENQNYENKFIAIQDLSHNILYCIIIKLLQKYCKIILHK